VSRSALIRFSGLIAMLGGVLWITSWVFNLFTQDGTRAILGLSERGWRRLLDPAMVSFIACLGGVRAAHRGELKGLGQAGFVISLVALATMLAGNVAEFWIGGPLYDLGWTMVLLGVIVVAFGLLILGFGIFRAKVFSTWRRFVALLLGGVFVACVLVGLLLWVWLGDRAAGPIFFFAMVFVFGVTWMLLGFTLWSENLERGVPSAAP